MSHRLVEKDLKRNLIDYKEICKFMKRVFPREELMPMWLIRLLTIKNNYNCKVYYDEELFVGILFTIESKDTVFVFYLAVNDEIQSKGYGSKLIKVLNEQYPDKSLTLFIETMDDKTADNYEQRVKRLAFYESNGFIHTGVKAGFNKPFVDILSTDRNYDVEKAKKLMKLIPMKIVI